MSSAASSLEAGAVAGDEHEVVATRREPDGEGAPMPADAPVTSAVVTARTRSSAPATVVALASTGSPTCTSAMARFGILQPVTGDGAHHDVVGREQAVGRGLEQSRHRRRRRRFDEAPLLGREHAVGLDDLRVGDRADVAARLVARRRPRPAHDAGLPIWIAVAIVSGCSTGSPRTIGAEPDACHPSMRGVRVARPSAAYSE